MAAVPRSEGAVWLAAGMIVLGGVTCVLPGYVAEQGGTAGDGAGGTGGVGAGTGTGGAGGTAASGAGGATAGGGGAGASGGSECGNGVIEEGEECDSTDPANPWCTECTVVCEDPDKLDGTTNHCYRLATGAMATWKLDPSREACKAWGGDLVAISSEAELKFIQDQFLDSCNSIWTGGSGVGQGDPDGIWSNGEPWYSAWHAGEPNAGQDTCVTLLEDCRYADEDCTSEHLGYMCERYPVGTPSQ